MTTGASASHTLPAQRSVVPLVRACHLQPTLAVTAITTTLAASAGRGAAGTVAVAVAVLAGQLSVGWSNDFVDRERDAMAGRLDKPIVSGEVSAKAVAIAAGVAFVAVVPLSLLSGWRAASVHIAAVVVAWLYNIWLKATAVSIVAFAAAFGALPAFVTLGLPGHPAPPAWAVVSAASLGAGAHLINALPDLEEDRRLGVRGLPHRLGAVASVWCGTALIALATLVLLFAPAGRPEVVAIVLAVPALVAVAAVAVLVVRGRLRQAWTFVLIAAGAAALVLIAQGNQLT